MTLLEHIKNLSQTMRLKGYANAFQSSSGHTDNLKDNLTNHVIHCLQHKKEIEPIKLLTYTHWKDEESPYIRCTFHINFDQLFGFKVKQIDIEHAHRADIIKNQAVKLDRNSHIPDVSEVNSMVMPRRKSLRI